MRAPVSATTEDKARASQVMEPQPLRIAELTQLYRGRGPLLNIVLDGWGLGDHGEGDALYQARTPTLDALLAGHPGGAIFTHGHYVGLPAAGDIGGSEVGHMTMGAGQILAQGPTRIKALMESGAFFRGEALRALMTHCVAGGGALHLLGLFSDGNVHSHISHFETVVRHAAECGVKRLYLHILLDGRDVPYQSALDYVAPMEALLAEITAAHPGWDYAIASGGGREVITMDRDQNWEKVRRGWEVHVHGREGQPAASATEVIRRARQGQPEMVDQDLPPFVVVRNGEPVGPMGDGDALIFMNFRGDRAIQFSRAMVEEDFKEFERGARPRVMFAGMAVYDEDTNLPPNRLIPAAHVAEPFGKRILELGLTQFRLAETQKYAHVTFFFNGGYRQPLEPAREDYLLIPSDKVDSYANAPAMKAAEIGAKAAELIRGGRHQFGLINFANADMVGHTGKLAAVVLAAEAVDRALGVITAALAEVGGLGLITADHGNGEEMVAHNPTTGRREPSTRHSLNPVPVVLFDPRAPQTIRPALRNDPRRPNTLANLMATNYILLGREPPTDVAEPLFVLS